MARILMTIIGRPEKDRDAEASGAYRTTTYRIPDGEGVPAGESSRTLFSGWALLEMGSFDEVIILGTEGSRWELLFEKAKEKMTPNEQQFLAQLFSATEEHKADEAILIPLAPVLSKHLGVSVQLRIIPGGASQEEQFNILKVVADTVGVGDRLTLDLSHGFRHLPILMFSAALYLKSVKNIEVDKVYSSFHSSDKGYAELFDLAGLLRISDWSSALSKFETNDDARVFVPLLQKDGAPNRILGELEKSGFAAQIHNYHSAMSHERNAASQLEGEPLNGLSGVFQQNLRDYLRRCDVRNPAEHLLLRAEGHLRHNNYDRAAIVGDIAFIAALAGPRERYWQYQVEQRIRADMEAGRRGNSQLQSAAREIHRIRNDFAHLNAFRNHGPNPFQSEETLGGCIGEALLKLREYLSQGRSVQYRSR